MTAPYSVVYSHETEIGSEVTVCVSLFDYQDYIATALNSVCHQTLLNLELLIVDDYSTDQSLEVASAWLHDNGSRFKRAQLVRHAANCGLAAARNTAFSLSRTPLVFVLDSDNELYPRCIEDCWFALQDTDAAFAYPIIEKFGSEKGLMGTDLWSTERLAKGNYIDAMALVRRAIWDAIGGYAQMEVSGWEDYDLWCKIAEQGGYGVQVPQILARYRVHGNSMLRTHTSSATKLPSLLKEMRVRHPWLRI